MEGAAQVQKYSAWRPPPGEMGREYEDQLYVVDSDGPVYLYSQNAWLKVADIQSYADRPLFPAPVVNGQSLQC